MNDLIGNALIVKSGDVVQGSSVTQVNIPNAIGYAKYQITVQDEGQAWQVPAKTKSEDLESIRIVITARTDFDISGATLDGVTTNYLKARYKETDGRTRNKAFGVENWAFEKKQDCEIIADSSAPTAYDVLLATFVGDGSSSLIITQNDISIMPDSDKVDGADLDTDDTLSADSDTRVPSQQAAKGYIDTLVAQNVKLTGAQSIDGVKTFSSIPVLPGSNPTSSNQAARKGYVDIRTYISGSVTSDDYYLHEYLPAMTVGQVNYLIMSHTNTSSSTARFWYIHAPSGGTYYVSAVITPPSVVGNISGGDRITSRSITAGYSAMAIVFIRRLS